MYVYAIVLKCSFLFSPRGGGRVYFMYRLGADLKNKQKQKKPVCRCDCDGLDALLCESARGHKKG